MIGSELVALGKELATWVPPKAKNKKRNVPTNSPVMATKWPFILCPKDSGSSVVLRP